jgi:Zn-dependent M16 (insulinase) family peptidase
LEVIIAKILQELPYEKRDGAKVADAYLFELAYDAAKSTSEACSLLRSLEFIPEIARTLKEDPESVISKLEATRDYRKSITNAADRSVEPFHYARVCAR